MFNNPWRCTICAVAGGAYVGVSCCHPANAAPDTLPVSVVAAVVPGSTVSTIIAGGNHYTANPMADEPISGPIWPTYHWSDTTKPILAGEGLFSDRSVARTSNWASGTPYPHQAPLQKIPTDA
jgi:hypothetical protein